MQARPWSHSNDCTESNESIKKHSLLWINGFLKIVQAFLWPSVLSSSDRNLFHPNSQRAELVNSPISHSALRSGWEKLGGEFSRGNRYRRAASHRHHSLDRTMRTTWQTTKKLHSRMKILRKYPAIWSYPSHFSSQVSTAALMHNRIDHWYLSVAFHHLRHWKISKKINKYIINELH